MILVLVGLTLEGSEVHAQDVTKTHWGKGLTHSSTTPLAFTPPWSIAYAKSPCVSLCSGQYTSACLNILAASAHSLASQCMVPRLRMRRTELVTRFTSPWKRDRLLRQSCVREAQREAAKMMAAAAKKKKMEEDREKRRVG